MLTYFVVQSFERGRKGALVADQPIEAQGREHAERMAERLSQLKAAVIAFSRTGDPASGEYEDAVIIASYGSFAEGEVAMAG